MSEHDWYLKVNVRAGHLRLLVTIDTYRNLTQVAEVTHVCVPAVARSLAELERGPGLMLFERTASGRRQHRRILPFWRRILQARSDPAIIPSSAA